MLDDGEININLQKMNKAEVWDRALLGQGGEVVDEFTREEQKKKIMLERFQDEVMQQMYIDNCSLYYIYIFH